MYLDGGQLFSVGAHASQDGLGLGILRTVGAVNLRLSDLSGLPEAPVVALAVPR